MDWVGVYCIVGITIRLIGGIILHNQDIKMKYMYYDGIIHFIITLPIYGRIFGWW